MDWSSDLFHLFIIIWLSLILFATILQSLGILNEKWKNLSIVENLWKIFNIKTENSDKIVNKKVIFNLSNESRTLLQLNSVISHYFFEFYHERDLPPFAPMPTGTISLVLEYLMLLGVRFNFCYAFFMSGNKAFKFIYRDSSMKIESNWKWIARYYFGKFTQIAPFYYVLIFFNNFYLKYLTNDSMKDPLVEKVCRESVVSNMLFISNFSRPDRMVSNIQYKYHDTMIHLSLNFYHL